MDVAVSDVAEGADPGTRVEAFDGGRGLVQKFGDPGDGNRDVVLPATAFWPLGRGLFLAHLPEGGALGIVLGDGGVVDQAGLEGVGQQPLQGRIGRTGLARDQFDQDVPGRRAVQRLAGVGDVGEDEAHADPLHQLEGLDPAAGFGLGAGQQFDSGRRRIQPDHRRRATAHDGEQFQGRGCNHTQGALGPDQQLLQVVAGIVLAEPFEAVEDLAVRHHGLNAEDQIAHHAVAEHGGAAGIGRNDPADGGRAFGGEAEREKPVSGGGGLLGFQKGHPRLDRHGIIKRGDVANLAQLSR